MNIPYCYLNKGVFLLGRVKNRETLRLDTFKIRINMKQIIYLLLVLSVVSCKNNNTAYEQNFEEDYIDSIQVEISPFDSFTPFKMGILKPETAISSKSIDHLVDSVELKFEREYYKSIVKLEELIAFKGGGDNELLNGADSVVEAELKYLTDHKAEILSFKWFELLSSQATMLYKYYFYASIKGTEIVEVSGLNNMSPIELMDSLKLDYLLIYDDIQVTSGHEVSLKLRESLFSSEVGRPIIVSTIVSDLSTCSNDLSCLIINSIRQNIDINTMEIRKRQVE